jgi:hypothetical protein
MLAEPSLFADLLSKLSAFLSDVPLAEMDGEIARCLDLVRTSSGIDCCGLMEVCADRKQIQTLLVSREDGSERQAESMQTLNRFPWVYRRLVEEGRPMAFSPLEKLPPEADGEKDFWENSGIRTLLMIPLRFGGEVTHLIGLVNRRNGLEWPENYPRILRVVGEMIAKALILRSDREKLWRRDRELAEVRSIPNLGSWEWDLIRGRGLLSDEVFRIFGRPPAHFAVTREAFYKWIHPKDRPLMQ